METSAVVIGYIIPYYEALNLALCINNVTDKYEANMEDKEDRDCLIENFLHSKSQLTKNWEVCTLSNGLTNICAPSTYGEYNERRYFIKFIIETDFEDKSRWEWNEAFSNVYSYSQLMNILSNLSTPYGELIEYLQQVKCQSLIEYLNTTEVVITSTKYEIY